jgi:hypothetical protein
VEVNQEYYCAQNGLKIVQPVIILQVRWHVHLVHPHNVTHHIEQHRCYKIPPCRADYFAMPENVNPGGNRNERGPYFKPVECDANEMMLVQIVIEFPNGKCMQAIRQMFGIHVRTFSIELLPGRE